MLTTTNESDVVHREDGSVKFPTFLTVKETKLNDVMKFSSG